MLLSLLSAALFAAIQPEAATVQPADGQDIVVTGERMKRIRVATKHDRKTGLDRCIVKRTSGDPGLDASICEVVLECAKTARKRVQMEACLAPRLAEIARQSAHRKSVPQ
jgi:hypothetical protein